MHSGGKDGVSDRLLMRSVSGMLGRTLTLYTPGPCHRVGVQEFHDIDDQNSQLWRTISAGTVA